MTTPASQTPGALGSGSSYLRKHYPGGTQPSSSNLMTMQYDPSMDEYVLRDASGKEIWRVSSYDLQQRPPAAQAQYGQWYTGTHAPSLYSALTGASTYNYTIGSSTGAIVYSGSGGSGSLSAYNVYGHGAGGARAHNFSTDLKSEGIRAGEIIAWRAWRVCGVHLRSAVMDSVWSEHEPMNGDPIKDYGVHAYNDKDGPYRDGYAGPGTMIAFCDGWVTGQVALWGEIVEHKHGYRAQYGKIRSLDHWYEPIPTSQRETIIDKYLRKPNGQQAVE